MAAQFEFHYNFEGQNAPCLIQATVPIPKPHTPPSGRPTPTFFNTTNNFGMELTPPPSALGPYETYDQKPEASQYTGGYINHDMATPPLEFPQVTYPADNVTYNLPSWEWPVDNGPATFFGITQTEVFSQQYTPPPHQAVQERSTALHRAQGSGKATKRSRMPMVMVARKAAGTPGTIEATLCAKGRFKCPLKPCKSTFVRQEHLKRHVQTVHIKGERFDCPFCPRFFSRNDNRKTHVEIHGNKNSNSSRTRYHPDAEAWLKARSNKRSRGGKKTGHQKNTKPKRAAR